MSIEFPAGSGVNFGYVPHVTNHNRRSFSMWIYKTAAPIGTSDAILAIFSDGAGILISLTTDRQIQYYSVNTSTLGIFKSPISSVPLNQWVHVVVTMDLTTLTNSPKIYINGVSQTVTVAVAPGGTRKYEGGCQLVIGNLKTATGDYNGAFEGKIRGVQIYAHVLPQDEVDTLYNAGTYDGMIDIPAEKGWEEISLMFAAFFIPTDRASQYPVDQPLAENQKLRDSMFGMIGTPHGNPILRSP
jgi:hypothetical protein